MAINIGNEAIAAISELRGNPDFGRLLGALEIAVQRHVYAALDAPVEQQVKQSSHAKGMFEIVEALRMANEGKLSSQLGRAPPPKSRREYAE